MLHNRNPHHNPERAKTPFPALVERWQQVRAASWSPKSRARYEQVCRTHLLPGFGGATVGEISREWVRDFLAGMAAEERDDGTPRYAPGTVHKAHTTLSAIMTEAVERGIVTDNPCRGVMRNVVKPERRKMMVLTPAEVHALAAAVAAKHPPYRALILTAAFTGLRAGELHALRRRDVNLLERKLVVARAVKTWRNGQPVFGTTKTDRVRRVVLAPELCDVLANHMTPDGHPDDLVFTSMVGGGAIHQVAFLRNHFQASARGGTACSRGLALPRPTTHVRVAADSARRERKGHCRASWPCQCRHDFERVRAPVPRRRRTRRNGAQRSVGQGRVERGAVAAGSGLNRGHGGGHSAHTRPESPYVARDRA